MPLDHGTHSTIDNKNSPTELFLQTGTFLRCETNWENYKILNLSNGMDASKQFRAWQQIFFFLQMYIFWPSQKNSTMVKKYNGEVAARDDIKVTWKTKSVYRADRGRWGSVNSQELNLQTAVQMYQTIFTTIVWSQTNWKIYITNTYTARYSSDLRKWSFSW